MYCIFFTKRNPCFAYLYVGIAKIGKCCDVVHFGTHVQVLLLWGKIQSLFNAYIQLLQMWVKQTHIGHK